ncbi:ATP-binding protein [Streptomyces griseoluteus]
MTRTGAMTHHRTKRAPMPGTRGRRMGTAAQSHDDQPLAVPQSVYGDCYGQALLAVPALGSSVRTCRDFTASLLHCWGICDEECNSAVLVVDELAANSARHGHARMTLLLRVGRRSLLIALADFGKGTPDPSSSVGLDADEHGRGMHIVATLAQWIEVQHSNRGHQVLVALPHSRGRTPPAANGDTPATACPQDGSGGNLLPV